MVEASGAVVYVNEPTNPSHPPGRSPGVFNAEVDCRFQYICADNEERWVTAFTDTLRLRYHLLAELRCNHAAYDLAKAAKYSTYFTVGRMRGRRAVIHDPFSTFAAAWLAQRMGCAVIISVRHPLSLVGSWRRRGWKANLHDLLGQPLLMRDLLGPYEDDLRAIADSDDQVAKVATLWRVTYDLMGDLDERQPGLLHIKRYEDLATNPEAGFRDLYGICGLSWTERARKRIKWATTDHGKPEDRLYSWVLRGGVSRTAFRPMDSRSSLDTFRSWLSKEDIEKVHEITGNVAARYYDAKDGVTPV